MFAVGTEIHLVNRLGKRFAPLGKKVITLDESGCLCTTRSKRLRERLFHGEQIGVAVAPVDLDRAAERNGGRSRVARRFEKEAFGFQGRGRLGVLRTVLPAESNGLFVQRAQGGEGIGRRELICGKCKCSLEPSHPSTDNDDLEILHGR